MATLETARTLCEDHVVRFYSDMLE